MLDKTRNWKEMSSIQSALYMQDCIIKDGDLAGILLDRCTYMVHVTNFELMISGQQPSNLFNTCNEQCTYILI